MPKLKKINTLRGKEAVEYLKKIREEWRSTPKKRQIARKYGFDSGAEIECLEQAIKDGADITYHPELWDYVKPQTEHTYAPDYKLENNNIYVEFKGQLWSEERKKLLRVRECNPDKDLRVILQKANQPMERNAKTTAEEWCDQNGFKWAIKYFPKEWLTE